MMQRHIAYSAALFVLAGCSTTPKDPNFTAELTGQYQAIADCALVGLRERDRIWAKTDFPSQNRAELGIIMDGVETARIVVIGTGPNTTRVESYHQQAVWGRDYWANRHRPIFERCAGQSRS